MSEDPGGPGRPEGRYLVEGHAVVSANGMIADASGGMPAVLINRADFARFQLSLDRAAVVVVGRKGHVRHPNPGRGRLVFSSVVDTLTRDLSDPLATFMNPAKVTLWRALSELGIEEGIVAITGGRSLFDHFANDYDAFKLSEVNGEVVANGIPCFSTGHPRTVLAAHGLAPRSSLTIDAAAGITLTDWVRLP